MSRIVLLLLVIFYSIIYLLELPIDNVLVSIAVIISALGIIFRVCFMPEDGIILDVALLFLIMLINTNLGAWAW